MAFRFFLRRVSWLLICFEWLPALCLAEVQTLDNTLISGISQILYSQKSLGAPGSVDWSDLTFSSNRPNEKIKVDVALFRLRREEEKDWTTVGVGGKMSWKGGQMHIFSNQTDDDNDAVIKYCCGKDELQVELCHEEDRGRLILNTALFDGVHRVVEVDGNHNGSSFANNDGRVVLVTNAGSFLTSNYVLFFANCNDDPNGPEINVKGDVVWESRWGYLPGQYIIGFLSCAAYAIMYLLLLCSYGYSNSRSSSQQHQQEQDLFFCSLLKKSSFWILFSISCAWLEFCIRTGDYISWNHLGIRQLKFAYLGFFVGSMKTGVTRCFMVTSCLGAELFGRRGCVCGGTIQSNVSNNCCYVCLSSQSLKIFATIVLGIFYVVSSTICECTKFRIIQESGTLRMHEKAELLNQVAVLNGAIRKVDFVFAVWIVVAYIRTFLHLRRESSRANTNSVCSENNDDDNGNREIDLSKEATSVEITGASNETANAMVALNLYRRLGWTCFLWVLFKIAFRFFSLQSIVQNQHKMDLIQERQETILDGLEELIHLFFVTMLAVSWWPQGHKNHINLEALGYSSLHVDDAELNGEGNNNEFELSCLSNGRDGDGDGDSDGDV